MEARNQVPCILISILTWIIVLSNIKIPIEYELNGETRTISNRRSWHTITLMTANTIFSRRVMSAHTEHLVIGKTTWGKQKFNVTKSLLTCKVKTL